MAYHQIIKTEEIMIKTTIQITQLPTPNRSSSSINLSTEEFLDLKRQINDISSSVNHIENKKDKDLYIIIPCDKEGSISREDFNKVVELMTKKYQDEFDYFKKTQEQGAK